MTYSTIIKKSEKHNRFTGRQTVKTVFGKKSTVIKGKANQRHIFTMVSYFLRWTLLIFFSSIPDEQSQQKVRRLGRITCVVIDTSNEVKCPLLWGFWIKNFSWRILEWVFVGNIVNIRNECLFFWVHGEWIVARNKQITREPLRGSRDLFVPRYDSYPMNPEKKTLIP